MTMPVKEPPCFRCKRFICEFDNWHCAAFPDEIPEDILSGINRHTESVPGDKGLTFIEGPFTYA